MKRLLALCVFAATVAGCSSTLNRKLEPRNETMVFANDSATFYKNEGNNRVTPGDRRKVVPNDTVRVISYSWDRVPFSTNYETHSEYLIVQGKDTSWVDTKDLITKSELQKRNANAEFQRLLQEEQAEFIANGRAVILPRNQSDEAWGRAVSFVAKNSDMKVQIATDLMIDTYNPTSESKSGYTITRRVQGDEVIIEIVAKGSGRGGQAYKFIKFGR